MIRLEIDMNDRYRFRAFIDNEYIKGEFITPCIHEEGVWYYSGFRDGFFDETIIIPPENVMQSTGLRDKNKNLIFEGDFLKLDGYGIYKVGFTTDSQCGFEVDMVKYTAPLELHMIFVDFDEDSSKFYEIIGNVYEHPHLLEQTG